MLDVTIIVALILGVVEAAKRSGMDSRWAPILSIVLGVLYSISLTSGQWSDLIVEGILLGLTAAGLYSGTKKVVINK